MKKKHTIPAILLFISVMSCTVFEDRSPCPCWLDYYIPDGSIPTETINIHGWSENFSFQDTVIFYGEECIHEKEVKREVLTTLAYSGLTKGVLDGFIYFIPVGKDSDSIYTYNKTIDCNRESVTDTIIMRKQFARVYLKLKLPETDKHSYTIIVNSDVNGIEMTSSEPQEGEFQKILPVMTEDVVFTLPRQIPESNALEIELYKNNTHVHTIELARIIRKQGYDWTEVSLKDIFVTADYTDTDVTISFKDWGILDKTA